tara:strand:- start:1104 stop:1703 length:600 start_codon:yes stop_codon:yes gene_type:complete
MYRKIIKRFFDILIGFTGLILFSPIFLIIIVGLSIYNFGNPFFYQKRPGKNAVLFKIIKFKTMSDKMDDNGKLLPDAKRLSKLGKLLRKTSLDELPQIINVLKGDMTIIGPRPLLPEYLAFYSNRQKKRHLVKPGITGWAQINGRNAISWEDKFEFDVWYVENLSFTLDFKIFLMTFIKVLKSEGINNINSTTAKPFDG